MVHQRIFCLSPFQIIALGQMMTSPQQRCSKPAVTEDGSKTPFCGSASSSHGVDLLPSMLINSSVFINRYHLFINFPSCSVVFCVSVPVETPQTILFGKKNASFIAVMKFPFSKCVHRFLILYLKHSLLSKYTQCSVLQRTY